MNVYRCEEMMCEHCVARITQALTAENIDHQVDLKTKTVTIRNGENGAVKAEEILDDLGYTPVKIS